MHPGEGLVTRAECCEGCSAVFCLIHLSASFSLRNEEEERLIAVYEFAILQTELPLFSPQTLLFRRLSLALLDGVVLLTTAALVAVLPADDSAPATIEAAAATCSSSTENRVSSHSFFASLSLTAFTPTTIPTTIMAMQATATRAM